VRTSTASTPIPRTIGARGMRRGSRRQCGTAPQSGQKDARGDTSRRHTEQGRASERWLSAISLFTAHRAFLAGGGRRRPSSTVPCRYRPSGGSVPQRGTLSHGRALERRPARWIPCPSTGAAVEDSRRRSSGLTFGGAS
jgi:hypothetical protein